jgi:hypothetical protein
MWARVGSIQSSAASMPQTDVTMSHHVTYFHNDISKNTIIFHKNKRKSITLIYKDQDSSG